MSGRMGVVAGDALPEAERLLFQRHPQMRDWPVSPLEGPAMCLAQHVLSSCHRLLSYKLTLHICLTNTS